MYVQPQRGGLVDGLKEREAVEAVRLTAEPPAELFGVWGTLGRIGGPNAGTGNSGQPDSYAQGGGGQKTPAVDSLHHGNTFSFDIAGRRELVG